MFLGQRVEIVWPPHVYPGTLLRADQDNGPEYWWVRLDDPFPGPASGAPFYDTVVHERDMRLL